MKLSRQQEIIVSKLRDMRWHCGREWLNEIKDDRARISNLNNFYMAEKGFVIKGEPCKGTVCGKHKCPLYKRRAERIGTPLATQPTEAAPQEKMAHGKDCKVCQASIDYFNKHPTYSPTNSAV